VEQTLYIGASVMDNGNTVWCEGMLDELASILNNPYPAQ